MWSKFEKVIASKTFEAARERELQEVIQEAKRMASQIASRVWRGHYLVSLFPLDIAPVRRNFTIQLALSKPTLRNEVDSSELIRACISGLSVASKEKQCLYRLRAGVYIFCGNGSKHSPLEVR